MTEKEYTQFIRLIDVFAIGPVMIYGGAKSDNNLVKGILIFIGIATILYNGVNYIRNR